MRLRSGRSGEFFGCRKFPRCLETKSVQRYDLDSELQKKRVVFQTKLYELNGEIISREIAVVVPFDYVDPDEPLKQINTKARERSGGKPGNAHSSQSPPLRYATARRRLGPDTGRRTLQP